MPYAERAKERGVEIIHLNIGQPDVSSPEQFWDAVAAARRPVLEYSQSGGENSLRRRAVEYYRSLGIEVEFDDLLVTTAGSEALSFALTCGLNPGDEVIVPEPLYANYLGFSVAAGIKVIPIPTRIEDDFALPPTEAFEQRITSQTKAILICNPNNPTGTVYDNRQLEELREIVLQHNLFLISDEVYRDFVYTDERPRSVLQLDGLHDHAILTDSASKRFSLCGARIGFLVSRNRNLMGAALKMAQARLAPPTLDQIGVEACFDVPQQYFDGVRSEYMKRRDLLVQRLRGIPGVTCPNSNGAFYAMVRLPIDDGDRFCQWLLDSFDVNGKTVMMAPGSGFYETPGAGRDEVRIAYVVHQDKLNLAMDILEEALAAYPGRKVAVYP